MALDNLTERLWASDEASALTNEAAREIERLRKDRDAWMRGVADICAAIPLPDTLAATGSFGDLIAYIKANLPDPKKDQT